LKLLNALTIQVWRGCSRLFVVVEIMAVVIARQKNHQSPRNKKKLGSKNENCRYDRSELGCSSLVAPFADLELYCLFGTVPSLQM
jgi:hypothetical protein